MLSGPVPAQACAPQARTIGVTSIYATEGGPTTLDEIEASIAQQPPDTSFVEIVGGNHAGFGWFGVQEGDGEATITREEQQAQLLDATLALLEAVASV